jgi:hypothetical protein
MRLSFGLPLALGLVVAVVPPVTIGPSSVGDARRRGTPENAPVSAARRPRSSGSSRWGRPRAIETFFPDPKKTPPPAIISEASIHGGLEDPAARLASARRAPRGLHGATSPT